MDPMDEIATLLAELWSRNELAPLCLSTLGADGFPNSRFVDLKAVSEGRLHFGTDSRSPKALEFHQVKEVSLCSWWPSLQVQVRVRGTIERASASISDREFAKRSPVAQAIASTSVQSQEIASLDGLRQRLREFHAVGGTPVSRPATWWVYAVLPHQIEILRFSEDRIHVRKDYQKLGDEWRERLLSP